MAESQHYKRYSSKAVKEALLDTPVVFIMGARQTGKTTLVRSLTNPAWKFIDLDDQTQLNLVKEDPVGFIKSLTDDHIAIDEIQRLPQLLLAIKQSVDKDRKPGRFLLTGSANALVLPKVADSLAGRIETVLLNPLSECEIQNKKPLFLSEILNAKAPKSKNAANKNYLIERIVTGCFPEPLQRTTRQRAKAWYKQYIQSLVQKDVKELSDISHPEITLKLLKLTAYYSAKLVNFTEIGNKVGLDSETTKKYIQLLEQLFLVKPLLAWHSNEYKRLVKTPKLHLTDTGLVCAAREINEKFLMNHPTEVGGLLETFVINELQKQAAWLDHDTSFYHYRDKDKVEVDCIIENNRGDCFAVEVKASATLTPKDFHGLRRFKSISKDRFKMGVLLYDGEQTIPFGENLFAVPIYALWG